MIATDKSRFGTIAAIGVGAVVAVALLFGATVVPTQAQTDSQIIEQLQQQIAALQSQLQSLTGGGDSSGGGAGACTANFTTNMTVGSTGAGVLNLQKALNADSDTQLAVSGAGSPGNETEYFGPITRAAVIKFQEKHSADVLAPVGLSSGTGYVGPSTRAELNEFCSGSTSGGGDQTPGTSGVSISSDSQPSNGLFVRDASRVPFTNFTVTNNGSSDVTINSVVVEKAGLIDRSIFESVALTDSNLVQLGDARSLNSNDQATIGRSVTIPAGASRTFIVVGNSTTASLTNKAGQVGGLSVVAINASASVSGSLPITGASHTVNESLSIGSVDIDRGTNDPNTDRDREIGTNNYVFSSVRVTAGTEEDIRLNSVRWTQNGSIDSSDLANLMVDVDGTTYPVSVSGDEYTATFGGGILIEEGFSKNIAIRGDVVGDANGDTVQFDIEEASDIHVTGETFGYGITPNGTGGTPGSGSGFPTSGNPFFEGATVTITGGSISTISKSNAVPAQNIAINVANQPLGAFATNLTGEGLEVDGITFGLSITGGENGTDITSVTLVDENGSVIAGPVDGTNAGTGTNGEIVFSDLIEFPTGSKTYTLKGRLSTDFDNGETIQATTTVNSTYWTDPEGATTGDAFTLPGTEVNMNTMTVNAASLGISVGSTPAAQTVVAGASDFTFTNYVFDATASGEDVRLSSIPLEANGTLTATSSTINSCQLFDGSTALNTGSNVINGSDIASAGADTTFTFTNSLTIPKGDTKTLEMRCNIASGQSGDFQWGIDSSANPTVTGVQSGSDVSENISDSDGQVMTIGSAGTVAVSVDASDPQERWYVAGDEAEVGVFELLTTNEAFNLRDIEFALNTASSTGSDVSEIALYSGGSQIARKTSPSFTGNDELFSNLGFNLPKDDDTNISVRVKFPSIGTGQSGASGSLVRFSTTTDASNNEAQGIESGSVVSLDGNVGDTNGARYFRSLPTLAKLNLSNTILSAGTQTLYRFTVTADEADSIAVSKFTLNVATSGVSATNLKLIEQNTGLAVEELATLAGTTAEFNVGVGDHSNGYIEIAAGETKEFRLEATIADGDAGSDNGSVQVHLVEDSAYPALASGLMGVETALDDTENFVWSPMSTTTNIDTNDWTNGYRVPGIEFDDLESSTLTE